MITFRLFRAALSTRRVLSTNNVSRCFHKSITTLIDTSVTIGDVTVSNPPMGTNPNLIPTLPSRLEHFHTLPSTLPPCHISHLRWMLQKDFVLHQDFLLLGTPRLASERRHLLLLYAALLHREVEYVALSRDTSEADLKQRKEVSNGGSTVYVHQAPVRAAIHGRLLILDGLEKAERNVLPTLSNLLENRELPLDDGTMLVSPDVYDRHKMGIAVHPDFRVAAIGSLSEGESASLDPPLRSRFQARLVSSVDEGDVLVAASAGSQGILDMSTLKEMVKSTGDIGGVSIQSIQNAIRYIEMFQPSISPPAALNAHGMGINGGMITPQDVKSPLKLDGLNDTTTNPNFVATNTTNTVRDLIIAGFRSGNRAVACVGPKGSYKSAIASETAKAMGLKMELFSLHPDMTARDLLMVRGTDKESGDTSWRETPLTRAARRGTLVVLDGIDKIRTDTLTSLALVLEQGWVILPDGTRFYTHDDFRCIAIAHPPEKRSWITPEVRSIFHWIQVDPLPREELRDILMKLYPSLDEIILDKLLNLQKELDRVSVDSAAEKEALQLTMRKLKHICRRVERSPNELGRIIHNTLLTSFLPEWDQGIIAKCLSKCGIDVPDEGNDEISFDYGMVNELVKSCKRAASNPLLVPNPRFEENPGQARSELDILEAHRVGEKALLITGYQGVGKNKIVDHLLFKLNCEREYIQLHRDSTIQSLMMTPSVENGRIVYHDSPLVRAAKYGRILVLDEADKAPVEVVALLKGLIEDGQLSLPDGRVLCHDHSSDPDIISIHPDFRIWTLTNPAGFPFHGNDLAREMADVFSCHQVPPMDMESHRRVLKSYGPKVEVHLIEKIVETWEELRNAHKKGIISYPFSLREAVAVVKHLNAFPNDGIKEAVENVVSFDRLDTSLAKRLDTIFSSHGIRLLDSNTIERRPGRDHGTLSTPKTRASDPKHGKVDPDNTPHVGGNTWAGGTGGSDTAGLGGRGGPYRLDAGHPVHQISDEMKAQVSKEAQERARKMAQDALQKKLDDLKMGKLDWSRYTNLREQVDEQISQLKSYLRDLQKRSEERVWLKNHTSGEIDENKIVDLLSGEKDVFKRRGMPSDANNDSLQTQPIVIRLVVDISASMYRFNGYDQRLERLLEATLMMMETLKDDKRFQLYIIGHNGSSAKIPLVNPTTNMDENTQLQVLECMVANTQYTYAGDNTIDAISLVVDEAATGDLVIIISDANLKRYEITVNDLSPLQSQKVHAHLIFIGSLGDEASELAKKIPNERAQVCFHSADLPLIIKQIVTNAVRA
ncbi:hypothetical protein HJC23_008576 [Cyclotella cryptica]|uniref:ATPase dynein-related AAA domain-containing protein n=1 Tax=Cyclotella cryptica TaxID=29204 RepID=A0ABD3Q8L2_9STRA